MIAVRFIAVLGFALGTSLASADDTRSIAVIPAKSLPPFESAALYPSAKLKPAQPRPKPQLTAKFEKGKALGFKLASGDAVHVFVKPKDGIEVAIAEKLIVKPGQTVELKLANLLGVVEVFQKDGFAKVDRIVLTAPDDAGPDEKGHVPVQIGSDYRVEMPVPEGFYAVWLVPANGVRAIRIEDRIRVIPGKIVRIGN